MQLHAWLLLFIITADETLASSRHRCGGSVSLDPEPAGLITLTPAGPLTDTGRRESGTRQTDRTAPAARCTWMIDIPQGRMLLLKLARSESGANVSVRCVWTEGDRVLGGGGAAVLSGCDGGRANLTWTGTGHSSDAVQLSYYVQEDERNSTEQHTSPHSDPDPARQSWTGAGPAGREAVGGADWRRGHPFEARGTEYASGPTSRGQEPALTTSPLLGLILPGTADKETLPLPEEEPNNGADTSGAAHLTDSPMPGSDSTHPYFHAPHTLGSGALARSRGTQTNSSGELPGTRVADATDAAVSSSSTSLGSDAVHHTPEDGHATAHADQAVLGSSVAPHTSSVRAGGGDTASVPRGEAVSGAPAEKQPDSWRSQRSTHGLISQAAGAFTRDPLESPSAPQQDKSDGAGTETEPTPSSSPPSQQSQTYSPTARIPELDTAFSTEASFLQPNLSQTDSFESAASAVTSTTETLDPGSTQTQTDCPQSTESLAPSPPPGTLPPLTQTGRDETQTATLRTVDADATASAIVSSRGITPGSDWLSSFTGSSLAPSTPIALGDVVQGSDDAGKTHQESTESETPHPTYTLLHTPESPPTPVSLLPSSTTPHSSAPQHTLQTHTTSPLTPATTESPAHPTSNTTPLRAPTEHDLPLPPSTGVPATREPPRGHVTTTHVNPPSSTGASTEHARTGRKEEAEKEDGPRQRSPGNATTRAPAAAPSSRTTPHPSQETTFAHKPSASTPAWSSTATQTPKFYIVPDQPAAIRVESIELLLQMIVEESSSASPAGLEEDVKAWVEPHLLRAPGFSRLLGVWSSGHAVQSLVEFKTSQALQWLNAAGPSSLLERTGLAQAARGGRSFRSSKITNITVGGLQGDVCEWLLQCPAGYNCVSRSGPANYSCSSVCHFDHCHHHGICTHHQGQLPVCRCLVGEDFWFMGQRCDVRMTRARLVGTCLAILLIMVTVIAALALVAVRRYRALLIQAKVDQTRSSYRRFNHFDELSGRFWLRSLAGSADSLDNPAFTRSDELLHLRALDRPCCYHDDTLSLASTCPSHGAHINTIYPHSSQYGWRGSEMSVGDGVLDSGKASDLSVCSWPVEPIHWTPFPLLQQLASHRTPTVRVSRPRSYCEGMELVDLGKSWTA